MGRVTAGALAALAALVAAAAVASGPRASADQAAEEDEDVIEVTVRAPAGAVDDLRGGRLLLLVANSGDEALRLLALEPVAEVIDADVRFTFQSATGCAPVDGGTPSEGLDLPCDIAPRGQALLPVWVDVAALSRTGKTPVAFEVAYEQDGEGGTVLAVDDLVLGVFGESELVPALQVPSLLVLPGALFLVLLMVLWRSGARPPGREEDDFPVKASGLEFWVLAVIVSIGLVAAWLVTGRNLLHGYGYTDVRDLLLASGGLALAFAGGLWGWKVKTSSDKRKAAQREKARTLASGDSAVDALRKLAAWDDDESLLRPSRREGSTPPVLVYHTTEGQRVVGPQLLFDYDGQPSEELEAEIDRLRSERALAPLARRLDRALQARQVEVWWNGGGALRTVSDDEFGSAGQRTAAIAWREREQ